MQDYATLRSFAETLARDAGVIMLRYFNADDKSVETKDNETPVTIADQLINRLVIDRVAETFPEHGVLAEEGSSHEDRDQLWVCDPIDGTKGFIQRIPTALFSIAYVVHGQPKVAVIYDPFQDKLFSAVSGLGATLGGRPLQVSPTADLNQASIGITTGYKDIKERTALFDAFLQKGVNQVIVPGNVFKGSLVMQGTIDAYVFPGKSAHDIAAVKLLVEEAGGRVTDLRGEEQLYNGEIYGAIVSNGHLHEQVVQLVADFGPERYLGY